MAFASVRVSRNLSSQRFLPACSSEDRRSAETQLVWETQRSKLKGDGHGQGQGMKYYTDLLSYVGY